MKIKEFKKITAYSLALFTLAGCGGSDKNEPQTPYPTYTDATALGGETTTIDTSRSGHGFSTPAVNLTDAQEEQHLAGDANFETAFITTPSKEHPELDGLGPVFNNADCNSCHQRDGRPSTIVVPKGTEPKLLNSGDGIFLRISIESENLTCLQQTAENNYCAPIAVPQFSDQLFHRGVLKARHDWQRFGSIGQANVYVSYQFSEVTYPDGEVVTLKKPIFTVKNPYDAPNESFGDKNPTSRLLQSDVKFSPRNGMPVFGLGLLEAISEQDIIAAADPDDKDNDGISGRPNYVFDKVKADANDSYPVSLGRFGWKGNTPSVRQQSLGALRGDMGITNPLFPNESIKGTELHNDYMARTANVDTGMDADGSPEASQEFSDDVTFYVETLAVPARRNVAVPAVREGARLFDQINCTGCHTPSFTTAKEIEIGGLPGIDALLGQTIYPFTDMLLHDMGEGLADGRRDFLASGVEWKTRPLWGIGLTKTVNPGAGFLHDGRAKTLEQAILWHAGEALASTDKFKALTKQERDWLILFLKSL